MNVLVVGGAGYVGGGIVDQLKSKHSVTVYDSLIYEESYRKDVNFVNGDIRDTNKLLPLLDQSDAVIWLAALVGDGACAINPKLTFEINSESVKFLVENFKKRIVFLSTCSVYGAQDGLLDENSSVNPLSEYAKEFYRILKFDGVGLLACKFKGIKNFDDKVAPNKDLNEVVRAFEKVGFLVNTEFVDSKNEQKVYHAIYLRKVKNG